jgi:ribonucleoside-diphosphate reductase beta chain
MTIPARTTTVPSLLDRSGLPWRLYDKAKRLGTWDPATVDMAADRERWQTLNSREQALIVRLCAHFFGGEAAVAEDLVPFLVAIGRDGGRVEDGLYLATYLFEEAKHVEFFDRALSEVMGATDPAAAVPRGPAYEELFGERLPRAMAALLAPDAGMPERVRAGAVYQLIVEGTLAETGYHGLREVFASAGDRPGIPDGEPLLPGLAEGFRLIQRDESRHLAWGLYELDRLIRSEPAAWDVLEDELTTLLPLAVGVVQELLGPFVDHPDGVPFGLDPQAFVDYAQHQLMLRIGALQDARDGRPSRFEA